MNRLARIRRALGLSQIEMARRLGCSRRYLQEQEAGASPSRIITLAALGLVYEVRKLNPIQEDVS